MHAYAKGREKVQATFVMAEALCNNKQFQESLKAHVALKKLKEKYTWSEHESAFHDVEHARTLFNIGMECDNPSKCQSALNSATNAIEILKEKPRSLLYADGLLTIARFMMHTDDVHIYKLRMLTCATKALHILRTSEPTHAVAMAEAHKYIGLALIACGKTPQGLEHMRSSLELLKSAYGENHGITIETKKMITIVSKTMREIIVNE